MSCRRSILMTRVRVPRWPARGSAARISGSFSPPLSVMGWSENSAPDNRRRAEAVKFRHYRSEHTFGVLGLSSLPLIGVMVIVRAIVAVFAAGKLNIIEHDAEQAGIGFREV